MEAHNINIQKFVSRIKQQLSFLGFSDDAQSSIQQSLQEIISPPQLTQVEQKELAIILNALITNEGSDALINLSNLIENFMSTNLYEQMGLYLQQIDQLPQLESRYNQVVANLETLTNQVIQAYATAKRETERLVFAKEHSVKDAIRNFLNGIAGYFPD